jgi:hypothetical protein
MSLKGTYSDGACCCVGLFKSILVMGWLFVKRAYRLRGVFDISIV